MLRKNRAFTLIELLVVIAIIGILAGLLLPALAAARRQARLAACQNNLSNIGKAVTSYTGMFGEYFPAYGGYGKDYKGGLGFGYQIGTNKQGGTVATNRGFPTIASRYSVVAFNTLRSPATLVKGKLNFMPCGLGLIVHDDFLPDPNALMCSSMTSQDDARYWDDDAGIPYDGNSTDQAFQYLPDVWRRLGGGDPNIIRFGDGTGLPSHFGDKYVVAIRVGYSYRLQSTYWSGGRPEETVTIGYRKSDGEPRFLNEAEAGAEQARDPYDKQYYGVHKIGFMCPVYKTARALGDRAYVSDCFDYAAGMKSGVSAHGGKYNVLYGDSHVKMYADTEERISNWDLGSGTSGTNNLTCSGLTILTRDSNGRPLTGTTGKGEEVWHMLDQSEGFDQPK